METKYFTEEQAAELRRKYNPDGSGIREHQMELVEILKALADICNEHNIRWWLSSGTCLGAVRHNGFVPWDDDVDIEMFREDYKKLEKILRNLQSDTYVLHSRKTDIEYVRCFDKFRKRDGQEHSRDRRRDWYRWAGNYIDIFVLEKTSHFSAFVTGVIYKNLVHLSSYVKIGWLRHSLTRLVQWLCLCVINPIFRVVGLINPKGEYHYTLGMGWAKYTFHKDAILPLSTAVFEGVEFPVPHDVDRYLTGLYGDWRKLPSEETIKRNIHRVTFVDEIFGEGEGSVSK